MLTNVQKIRRHDVALYIIGSLLVLSVFSGCTQLAPPLPAKAKQALVEEPKKEDPTPAVSPSPAPETSPVPSASPAVEPPKPIEGELEYLIPNDFAKVLFQSIKVKKVKGKVDGTFVKAGKNYTCTDNKTTYDCKFTIITKDGSIKENNTIESGSAEIDPVVAVGKDNDIFQLTLDETTKDRNTHLDLSIENSKKIYEQMTSIKEATITGGVQKKGKQVSCIKWSNNGSIECRVWMKWSTGEIEIVE